MLCLCLLLLMDQRERTMAATDNQRDSSPTPSLSPPPSPTSTPPPRDGGRSMTPQRQQRGDSPATNATTPATVTASPVVTASGKTTAATVDPEGLGTRSAFEITSVHVSPEDTEETETAVSKDRDELQKSLLEAEERNPHNRFSISSADSEQDLPIAIDSSSEKSSLTGAPDSFPANPSPKPLTADMAAPANGPAHLAPSRFRKVNQYLRGRWWVRDALEPEERPESEMRMATFTTAPLSNKNSNLESSSSPSIVRKQNSACPDRIHDNEGSEHGDMVLPHHVGNPLPPCSAAESINSLSRTGSMASVRDLVTHEDPESTGIPDHTVATVGTASQPPSTILDRSTDPECLCDDCSSVSQDKSLQDQQHTLESAMCHLKNQLSLFLQGSPYKTLVEERHKLVKENEHLKEQVQSLQQELERLKSHSSYTDYDSSTPPTSNP